VSAMSVAIDARVELLSAVFLLAGAPEYIAAFDTPYRRAVATHLAPFADHAVVEASRRARVEAGVSHDAPLALAVRLDPMLRLADPSPFDPRWSGVDLARYVDALRDFAASADHAELMRSQATYLAQVERRFDALADPQLVRWFDERFGHRIATRSITPGMLTGVMSYGLRTDQEGERFILVMSLEQLDDASLPLLAEVSRTLLAHELAHCYLNPVLGAHHADLAPLFQPRYDRVREEMAQHSYGSLEIVLAETVVRAVTLLYVHDRLGEDAAARVVRDDLKRAFVWTSDLARTLEDCRSGGPLTDEVIVASVHQVFG